MSMKVYEGLWRSMEVYEGEGATGATGTGSEAPPGSLGGASGPVPVAS